MVRTQVVSGTVALALVAALGAPATAAEKESRKCRKEIGAKFSKVVKTELDLIEKCHKARNKGKFDGDCNDLSQADTKGKKAKAEASATKGVDKKCLPGDVVLGNYPVGDPDGTFFPIAEDAAEQSGSVLLGSPALGGDKAKVKCHAEIAKAASKNVQEIVKLAVKCQNGIDKAATSFEAIAGNCVATPVKAGPKGESAITKKCAGLTGADVGSCDPLPGCVTAASTTTGQTLAAALYGEPTVSCGNTLVEAGEECDDGNQRTTDACIDCQLATCGDGYVHAGVELCGDAPADACTTPDPNTCAQNLQPCGDEGQRQRVRVRFAKPGSVSVLGLVIALDYPEPFVGVPGFANDQAAADRVTDVPTFLYQVNDRDYEIEVTATSALDPIPAGTFFTIDLDVCDPGPGAATLGQFGCDVRQASNLNGDLVTDQVTCSVVFP